MNSKQDIPSDKLPSIPSDKLSDTIKYDSYLHISEATPMTNMDLYEFEFSPEYRPDVQKELSPIQDILARMRRFW